MDKHSSLFISSISQTFVSKPVAYLSVAPFAAAAQISY